MRLNAAAFRASSDTAPSQTATLPPGRVTRRISRSTASGSRKWWKEYRQTTIENEASAKGSGSTSPTWKHAFRRPFSAASARARSTMAGVRSIPTASRAAAANAQVTMPGPEATSSTVSSATILFM